MTEKRFTIKEFSTLDNMASIDVICDDGIELPTSTACDLLNSLSYENEQLREEIKVLTDYGIELLEYINSPPKHRKSIFDAVICFKNKKGDVE